MSGYSGTPLAKKLGIASGSEVFLIGAPVGFKALLEPLPEDVRFVSQLTAATTILHVFAVSRDDLERSVAACRTQMNSGAALWISWPKRASKVPTDITENVVREVALPLGLVDVKVAAVDEVWSGLKLVVRKALR
jgi:hypothetical protein